MDSVSTLVIVLDDSPESRGVIARIVEVGGFPAREASDVEHAVEFLDEAHDSARCLVIATSALAAEHSQTLLRHRRKPQLLLTCVRPPECPILPEMECANLGCIQKPMDFWHPSILISRVGELLAR
jgi:CheY-like chemotaxis protein